MLAGDSIVRHGRTRDIGGGGLSFDTQEVIPDLNVTIAISFDIRGVRVEASGRVIGASHDTANAIHTYRFVYSDISSETQTFLAAYVLRNSLDAIVTKALRRRE